MIGDSFGSTYVNDTFSDARVRRVIVQLQGSDRSSPGDVLRLLVRNRDGRLIPLSNLVRLEPTTGPTSINHSELSRAISIRANPNGASAAAKPWPPSSGCNSNATPPAPSCNSQA